MKVSGDGGGSVCSEGDAMISACVTSSAHFDDGARLHVIPSCLRVCAGAAPASRACNARGKAKRGTAWQLLYDNSSWGRWRSIMFGVW
jgi:hypothetical protein